MMDEHAPNGEIVPSVLRSSASVGSLVAALAKAAASFTTLRKDHFAEIETRSGSKYSYRYLSLSDAIDATRPALAAVGIVLVQAVATRDGCVVIESRLLHDSGEWLGSELAFVAANVIDPRNLGSLVTYLRRYSLLSLLNLSGSDDDDDAQAVTPKPPKRSAAQSPRRAETTDDRAADGLTDAMRKKLFASARTHKWSDESLRRMLEEKFGAVSTKQLRRDDFDQLIKILERGPSAATTAEPEPPL